MDNLRLEDEAAFFNKHPILEVLRLYCNEKTEIRKVLEIASGSGQHAQFFTQNISTIISFQPTEYDKEKIKIINLLNSGNNIVQPAKELDVSNTSDWKNFEDNFFDLCLVTNLCHISPWECTVLMFSGVSQKLKQGAFILIYGPFLVDFKPTTESNANFDQTLKDRNVEWGLRDISELEKVALKNGMLLHEKYAMPQNNFILVFKRNEA